VRIQPEAASITRRATRGLFNEVAAGRGEDRPLDSAGMTIGDHVSTLYGLPVRTVETAGPFPSVPGPVPWRCAVAGDGEDSDHDGLLTQWLAALPQSAAGPSLPVGPGLHRWVNTAEGRHHRVDEAVGRPQRDPWFDRYHDSCAAALTPCGRPNLQCACRIGYVHLDRLGPRDVFAGGLAARIPLVWPSAGSA
jgi:hypothetical protein